MFHKTLPKWQTNLVDGAYVEHLDGSGGHRQEPYPPRRMYDYGQAPEDD